MENNTMIKGETFLKLRRFNFIMGCFHFVQALMMFFLSIFWDKIRDFTPQIVGTFLGYNESLGVLQNQTDALFNLPFGVLVAMFLFISAFFSFLIK